MRFLCGCDMPSIDSLRGDPELHTLVTVAYDSEGLLICKVHGARRYGWRSTPHMQAPGLSYTVPIPGTLSFDPWDTQRFEIFGQDVITLILPPPQLQKPPENDGDPQFIGSVALSERAYEANGRVDEYPRRLLDAIQEFDPVDHMNASSRARRRMFSENERLARAR